MRPAAGTTVQNPVLSAFFTEYVEQAATRLAGLQALPMVDVPFKAGDITVMRREALLKVEDDLTRSPRGTYSRSEWDFDRMGYECEEYGIEYPLDDGETKQYEQYLDLRQNTTRLSIDRILRAQEIRIAAELFDASGTFAGYTGDVNANEWDDATNASPKADIDSAAATIAGQCGMYPTDLLIPYSVFLNVMRCDEIKGYSQYTSTLLASPIETQRAWLSAYLGVNIILGGAFYDSADEGQAASLSSIWGTEYGLLFVKTTGIGMPGIGWTLNWKDDSPANANVEQYREEQTRSWVYRARNHSTSTVYAPEFARLLANFTS